VSRCLNGGWTNHQGTGTLLYVLSVNLLCVITGINTVVGPLLKTLFVNLLCFITGLTMSEKPHCNVSKFFTWSHKTKHESLNITVCTVR
jgi:hypothetical protein